MIMTINEGFVLPCSLSPSLSLSLLVSLFVPSTDFITILL